MQKKFLIIGRTGTGKTTLAKGAAQKLGLSLLKSYCTRPLRPGEVDPDHIFISPDKIEDYRNRMIAYTDKVDEYERFATIEQLVDNDLYIIDPHGIDYLKSLSFPEMEQMKFIRIYIRLPFSTNIKRLRKRDGEDDAFLRRFEYEDAQFREFEKSQDWDYHILNVGTIDESINTLCRIMQKELKFT